jgi:hypothetical protein
MSEKTVEDNYKTVKSTIDTSTTDYEKFKSKKVKAAGQRARNNLLNAKKLCDTLRKQILEDIEGMPTKHRITDTAATTESVAVENCLVDVEEKPIEEKEKPIEEKEKKVRRSRKANKKVVDIKPEETEITLNTDKNII